MLHTENHYGLQLGEDSLSANWKWCGGSQGGSWGV